MTDLSDAELIDALLNPLLVTDERFDLTRQAAARIKRLKGLFDKWHTIAAEKHAEIERLRAPWRAVDDMDWDYIMSAIGDGGRDQFWKTVLYEMRAALAGKVQP